MGPCKWIASCIVLLSGVFIFGCGVKSPPVPYLTLDEDNSSERIEVEKTGANNAQKKADPKSSLELKGLSDREKK